MSLNFPFFCPHLRHIDGFAIAARERERRKCWDINPQIREIATKKKRSLTKNTRPEGNISKKQATTHVSPPQNTFGISLHTWKEGKEGRGSKVGRAAAHCTKPKAKKEKKSEWGKRTQESLSFVLPLLYQALGKFELPCKYQAGIPHL